MAKSISVKHKTVFRKKEQLDSIAARLKKEFIGIDHVIDEITDAVSAWYIFPEIQTKPVIVNLWGLTGVGKTSLVKRLVELLKYQNKYYRFDMGEVRDNNWAIRNQLEDIHTYGNSKPLILALDEFQHARTKNEMAQENINPATRIVWDLLDSGRFYINRYVRGIDHLNEYIKSLILCIKSGVKVKNGRVVYGHETYRKIFAQKHTFNLNELTEVQETLPNDEFLFVNDEMRNTIYDWVKEKFNHKSEFENYLSALNASETVAYLTELYDWSFAPVEVDCSKALIFVMGNLDEAYKMSNNFNPDMNADDFHEQSLRINITDIKNVLRKHFRSEQIARLGNLHIIYPAFSEESYQRIIADELEMIKETMLKHQHLLLDFELSIHQLIYREGVYPSQGTRPLFTTIHQIIKSRLSKVVYQKYLKNSNADLIKVSYSDGYMHFTYYLNNSIEFRFSEKPVLNLEILRAEKRDDLQAIVAVHESGHALVGTLLTGVVPARIFSSTADSDTAGFVYSKEQARYISRKTLMQKIAQMLGGYMAEKLVFGEDNITMGSESDIHSATEFALHAIKNCGMGKVALARYSQPDAAANLNICGDNDIVEKNAKELMSEAMKLAGDLLSQNKLLLLQLADYLSDFRTISSDKFTDIFRRYAAVNTTYSCPSIGQSEESVYRATLKKKVYESLSIEKKENGNSNFKKFNPEEDIDKVHLPAITAQEIAGMM